MKYFLVAGEASGDLHAAGLMRAIQAKDPDAVFRHYGGDSMKSVGGTQLRHYRTLAYMGFLPVLLHARTLLQGLAQCKQAILEWKPDAVILVDYPGFNLSIAKYVKRQRICPVFYYISPKIWAWKEYRIRNIRRDVDMLCSILPFEKEFFEGKHHYPVHYVGNPTLDEITQWLTSPEANPQSITAHLQLPSHRPIIALLPGSRMQEIHDNLGRMLQAITLLDSDVEAVVCAAPGIADETYRQILDRHGVTARVVRDHTYAVLRVSHAALVTSGTATLETALFGVPQVVCYHMGCGRLMNFLRRHFLKVPFISLVNLICGRQVVPELIGEQMNPENVCRHLRALLETPGMMQKDYGDLRQRLGDPGAPQHAAEHMTAFLKKQSSATPAHTSFLPS